MANGWNGNESPFHWGERMVQERLGVREIEDWARKVVRDYLPEQHRTFHTALPFLVVAARDSVGRPWVTLLEGPDGFVASPDPRSLVIKTRPAVGDALEDAFVKGAEIGILGIELSTRRRNRVNGRIEGTSAGDFTFSVEQSFGNCPQYIREREWRRVKNEPAGTPKNSNRLTQSQKDWIAAADTFFVASGYRGDGESATFGMDASHRGGDRGFVRVIDSTKFEFPDYAGNNHFNTIGNLILDPRAGFLFIDFETGSLLQLTGRAEIDWESKEIDRIPGARRLVTFTIEEIVELPSAVPLRWEAEAESVRSLRLVEKRPESDTVTSFLFEARDGGPLHPFAAGQHLPIELHVPGNEEPVRRTYSISSGPSLDHYRISVKREPKGLASRFLHDHVEIGTIIDTRKPAGEFMMTCSKCPLALVSAGVGLTPLVSMLHALAAEAGDRPVWFIHGARDGRHHPLAREVTTLAEKSANVRVHVAYSRPRPEDAIGVDFDSEGRINGALLSDLIDRIDTHYYICGPTPFMAALQTDLERGGVPADQLHFESFGPLG